MLYEVITNPEAVNVKEFPVVGMPASVNPSGAGWADYVLWGDNGLPLAVVEAKKTSINIHQGQHQAELYASCLEKMTGRITSYNVCYTKLLRLPDNNATILIKFGKSFGRMG